ncbi:PLASTID-LIPID-ASSOCIATED PROTEIN 10 CHLOROPLASTIC-RELATED [Salix koriyanagi]|uniref:PLASTID-LIPID-ASSOCIATED PROTEIN 10 CHLOROPLASTIC-RELATED n=1 Tax=Salix koriyanagi TaxID=2511006 RepID=A0A9Q0TEK6_9ROSI|nr:PLASTID-LIPID-ASSOCIATED PROTEIN 10 CHLOROPLASTIC-RELATED [Salix koriyanagi]
MNMAFATSLYPATGKRPIFKIIKPFTRNAATRRNFTVRRNFSCSATVATDITARVSEFDIENQKNDLLRLVQDTQRGLVTTPDQRSCIEEALVSLEGYTRGESVDLVPLDGTWRLQYTSAPDVLVLFESAARFPFFQVGQIFQKFECRDQSDGGVIRNVVKWSIPTLLEEQEGATLLVSAKFNVVSARNIYLQFEEISIQNIRISEELQALVAPALLPRSFLSLQILQFIRTFKAQIPVRNPGDPGRRSVGGLYYLSYLDHNMLLGRAVGGGGVFVFTRAQPFDL